MLRVEWASLKNNHHVCIQISKGSIDICNNLNDVVKLSSLCITNIIRKLSRDKILIATMGMANNTVNFPEANC